MPVNTKINVDTKQIAKLTMKLEKYPPVMIQAGLDSVSSYLNEDKFREGLYPPSQAGSPFQWSSEKQRRAFFATDGFGGGIPTKRTMKLMLSGKFKVEKKQSSLYVIYENIAPYFKYVQGQFSQIIGHVKRGWKPVNTTIVDKYGRTVMNEFIKGVEKAWQEMDKFITGGGAGL